MPENIRALIVLLVMASAVFIFGQGAACAVAIKKNAYRLRRNAWFGITLAGYLSHNFWIFIILSSAIMYICAKKDQNSLSLYLFLLFAMPQIRQNVFIANQYLFYIHYGHLLTFFILVPYLLSKNYTVSSIKFGYHTQDFIIIAYLFLLLLLNRNATTYGDVIRYYVYYPSIEIFIPYYVASRSLNKIEDFHDALMSFTMACMVLGVVATFECLRHWLLYSSLQPAMGVDWDYGKYLGRGAFLRALATPGQAIALGYVMAVSVGVLLYFKNLVGGIGVWRLGFITLIAGLISAFSRAPWIGAIIIIIIFIMTGPNATEKMVKLQLAALIGIIGLSLTPIWGGIIDYLPFLGSVDSENVEFRKNLLGGVLNVILENPLFGTSKPDLEQFRTGEGIIDIVNTYLNVGLESGLVGMAIFGLFFISTCFGIYRSMRTLKNRSSDIHRLGQTLLAVLIGIMLIIYTVSSVTIIPYVYWTLTGVGVAYVRLVRNETGKIRQKKQLS